MIMTPRLCLILFACLIATSGPASAHLLKVFARVDDGAVAGFGFFVGGGRPQGATVIMRDAEGKELWRGVPDKKGNFSWRPEKPVALTVILDARDGHIAEAKIAAERFGGEAPAAAAAADGPRGAEPTNDPATGPPAGCPRTVDATQIDRIIDKAVARQVEPLLEAYEVASGRARFNDVIGGIGMIVGLAGIGMWAASRRRNRPPPDVGTEA